MKRHSPVGADSNLDGADVRRREFMTLVGTVAAWPIVAGAQQAGKARHIGFLRVGAPPATFIEPFRRGLRELGYVEGESITIEYGIAESVIQLPNIAAELVRLNVSVLVASGTPSVVPASNATSTIPVVFVAAIDPVATGLVARLAHPGGNITGVSAVHADVTGKRLQILTELLPKISTIALLVRTGSPASDQYVKEAELAARTLGVQLRVLSVGGPSEFEAAFNAAGGASALLQVDDAMLTAHRVEIAELALKHRLPTLSGLRETVDAGGLMAYGPHYGDLYRLAARQVHELLKGAKPADLPVEQPTKFELIINLKTAKALGITVPPTLLARADEVVE